MEIFKLLSNNYKKINKYKDVILLDIYLKNIDKKMIIHIAI